MQTAVGQVPGIYHTDSVAAAMEEAAITAQQQNNNNNNNKQTNINTHKNWNLKYVGTKKVPWNFLQPVRHSGGTYLLHTLVVPKSWTLWWYLPVAHSGSTQILNTLVVPTCCTLW